MLETLYKSVVSPILDRLDSESMHHFALDLLHHTQSNALGRVALRYLGAGGPRIVDPRLNTTVGGVRFDNPTIVAAGWDKPARAVRGLYELGFGGVEIGTVLEFAQEGNPKPRQFVVAPGVVIQSLGFPSPGMEAVAANLDSYRGLNIPIGINISKNKEVTEADTPRAYAVVARRLYEYANFFVINVSSPNTPGLRTLQNRSLLTEIVRAVQEANRSCGPELPTFVKIAPDLTLELVDDVVDVVISNGLAGIVATNTSNNPELRAKYGEKWRNYTSGISGDDPEFRRMCLEKVRHIYRTTNGAVEIMGAGAIKDGATAYERIRAGAKAVQVMAAFRSEGLTVARKICRELLEIFDREGIRSIDEIVGLDAR